MFFGMFCLEALYKVMAILVWGNVEGVKINTPPALFNGIA